MPTFVADELVTAAKLNAATARDWDDWTPTYANLTKGNGTVAAWYIQVGKLVVARFVFVLGSSSAVGTNPTISLPVQAGPSTNWPTLGAALFLDSGTARLAGTVRTESDTVMSPKALSASGSYVTEADLSSTIPFTWTTSDVISIQVVYEAA